MLFYMFIMIKTIIEKFDTLGHPKTWMGPKTHICQLLWILSLNDQPNLNISTLKLVKQTYENIDILGHP